MLWESVEPGAALQERFGFDSVAAVTDWVTAVLDARWGTTVRGCPRVVISGDNAIVWVGTDQGGVVVKWSRARERFPSLAASTHLLRALAQGGIPVAAPIATVDGMDRVVLDGPSGALSVTVLPELTGDWLDVQDSAAVRSAGACLAQVHQVLGAGSHDVPGVPVRAGRLAQRIETWLASGDRGLAPEGSRRLESLLSQVPDLDDEPQLVHNDFRAANILTRGSTVVGVLDFDDVVVDHRVDDLAKACVYLGTRFRQWRPTPATVRRELREGYESVRRLSPAEQRWFEVLVLWQGLLAIPGEDDPAGWAAAV
jgi:Ser/Thr protein kinase RdoA (MazF antagonist)